MGERGEEIIGREVIGHFFDGRRDCRRSAIIVWNRSTVGHAAMIEQQELPIGFYPGEHVLAGEQLVKGDAFRGARVRAWKAT